MRDPHQPTGFVAVVVLLSLILTGFLGCIVVLVLAFRWASGGIG